jgi:hypothetical protein
MRIFRQHSEERRPNEGPLPATVVIREDGAVSDDCDDCSTVGMPTVASGETRAINILRAAVLLLLAFTAILSCVGVYFYTRNEEQLKYERAYEANALRIVESFHTTVERRLEAMHSLALSVTSYALDANKTFPFVTLPHFAMRGSALRIEASSLAVHWIPLVTDDTRKDWEEYALETRSHIDEAYEEDTELRLRQDEEFGYADERNRVLEEEARNETLLETNEEFAGVGAERNRMLDEKEPRNETILEDGTGFHPKIFSIGSKFPRGDEPEGSGPFLPLHQRR